MKKQTLTIGIPAYNEEANIGFLINDLLNQNLRTAALKNIIVSSDGSSDNTVGEVNKIRNKKVLVFNGKTRQGRAVRQNQIMKYINTDVLVLLDADVQIKDRNFLNKIIDPIIKGKADLTSVPVEELQVNSLFEKILDTSMKMKKDIFDKINNGHNIYTCHGRARAFSKKFYKSLKFKESIGEDAYSYLYCLKNEFKYIFIKNTRVFYKLPENFNDHKQQSIRFFSSQKIFYSEFGEGFVRKQYTIPKVVSISTLGEYVFKNPMILGYLFLMPFLKIKSFSGKHFENAWSTSLSSKRLRTN